MSSMQPKVLATSAFTPKPGQGVFPLAGNRGFFAAVQVNGKSKYLGKFADPFAAQSAVQSFMQGAPVKPILLTY